MENGNRNGKGKWVILGALLLVATWFLARPHLGGVPGAGFQVTERPAAALSEAKAKGSPVFLEFYATW